MNELELEIYKLEKMSRIGQNKAIISRLKRQIDELEKENASIQKEIEENARQKE